MAKAQRIIDLDKGIDPWERQKKDTEEAWQAFIFYRDSGEKRSFRATAEHFKLWHNTIFRMNLKFRWKERVLAYERHLDAQRQEVHKKEVVAMAKRHASVASSAIGVLSEPLKEAVRRINACLWTLEKISDTELLRLIRANASVLKDLVEIERVAMGAPGTVTAQIAGTASTTLADRIMRTFNEATEDAEASEDPGVIDAD